MGEPVKICLEIELVKYIRSALKNCAEDLDCELAGRYGLNFERYPTQVRRYKNDRAPVVDALYCIDQIDAACPDLVPKEGE